MIDRMQPGEVPAKPHTAFRSPSGALRFEECLTRRGFDGEFDLGAAGGEADAHRFLEAGFLFDRFGELDRVRAERLRVPGRHAGDGFYAAVLT